MKLFGQWRVEVECDEGREPTGCRDVAECVIVIRNC